MSKKMTSDDESNEAQESGLPRNKSDTEMFLKRLAETSNQETIMKNSLAGIHLEVDGELATVVYTEIYDKKWVFKLHTTRVLKAVILLHDLHRNNFLLNRIIATTTKEKKVLMDEELINAQEWISKFEENDDQMTYEIEVIFFTKCYGNFIQHVLFYFGQELALVKKLQVDVVLDKSPERIKELLKKFGLSLTERWTNVNASIIPFLTTSENTLVDTENVSMKYCIPTEQNFPITKSVDDDNVTINNYRSRMHQLLYIEEMACYEQLAKYNKPAVIQITNSLPSISGANTEKRSENGELFAIIFFDENISEDSPNGRLLLNKCTTVLVGDSKKVSENKMKNCNPNVCEAAIENIGRNVVYLRFSAKAVINLELKVTDKNICQKQLEIQFQLNRSFFCKWHQAIDKIFNLEIIFPDSLQVPKLLDINEIKWGDDDSKLNEKQKEAIAAITLPRDTTLPPVLIIGAFGTGKTYTLAQAMRPILLEGDSKILICTYSNSTADLYIKEYLHPYVKSGIKEATPLRIYHHEHRVPSTIDNTVLKYCLIQIQNDRKIFKIPTLEDILNHRIIVSTLDVAFYLSDIDLPGGHFTHILIDEATEALECEAVMSLSLANKKTRIVLAGDLAQSTPEIFSSFVKEKKFHISLLQRLCESYPTTYPKIILNENYRAHEAIVEFTSNIFYNNELISAADQPRHDKFYPLNFFSVKGPDVQVLSGFCNPAEVDELVKRVIELKNNWPSSWGKFNENLIAVLTPYQDQTDCIRLELMKYKLSNITVDNISNVQGEQFRVVFLSTVRTGFTCLSETKSKSVSLKDCSFLSNEKLLHIALTRAQSLVAVVGDPVLLCIFGRFCHIWRKFIDTCAENHSLYGLTLQEVKNHLWNIEQQRNAAANPSQLPYLQTAIKAPLGFPSFQTPSNSTFYPQTFLTSFATGPIMQMNQTPMVISSAMMPLSIPDSNTNVAAKFTQSPASNVPNAHMSQVTPTSTTYFMRQLQHNRMMYSPYAGVSVFPLVPPFPQFPSLMPSAEASSSITLSPSMQPNSTASFIAAKAMPQYAGDKCTAIPEPDGGDSVSVMQNRGHKNGVRNYMNLKTVQIDSSRLKFMDKMKPEEQEHCDELLAKAIISSGSPLTLVENQYFKSFLQKLCPSYKILDEKSLQKTHLDREFNEMNTHLIETMSDVRNIGIRIDSWDYLRSEYLINIILTLPEPILYKCIKITENEYTGEYTIEMVSNVIKEIGPERVFAIICHDASIVTKAKEIFAKKFPHITTMHCLSRSLDSIITFMLEKCNTLKTIRKQCFKIVNVIKKSNIWSPIFAKIKKDDPTRYQSGLVLPVPTRYGTLLRCFESILRNKSVLQTLVESESVQNAIQGTKLASSDDEFWNFFNDVVSFKAMLLDDAFWDRLNYTYSILQPIIKWISRLDEGSCRISDVVDAFIEIKSGLEILETNTITCIPIEERNNMVQYFKKRRKEALDEIHFAAYFLNPANIMDYKKLDSIMSLEEISAAFRFIHSMSRHTFLNIQAQRIMTEIAHYRTKKGSWKEDFLWENVNCLDFEPICWWKTFCSHTELSKIATRVLEIPVFSAATERSFSELSMKRNRLVGEDATKVTYIAHNMELMAQAKSEFNENQSELVENSEADELFDTEVADCATFVTSNTPRLKTNHESELNA